MLRVGVIATIVAICAVGTIAYVLHDAGERNDNVSTVAKVLDNVETAKVPKKPVEGMDANVLRRIDFKTLKGINSDVDAWLYVPDTAIDEYVMQERRLDHYEYDLKGIYKTYNGCGTFLKPAKVKDSDGKPIDDAHTLILGHRMNGYNGEWQFSNVPTRWATLDGANAHPYIYVYYPDHAERWRVWAAVDAWASDMIYDIPYALGSDEYQSLLDHIADSARYQAVDKPDKDTRTLVMSTCNRPTGGALMRFALVSVPDAEYYYDTGAYVDMNDAHAEDKWKNANADRDKEAALAAEDAARKAASASGDDLVNDPSL